MTTASMKLEAEALDAGDSLAHCRENFRLDPDVVYLDGNSLGPMPVTVPDRISKALNQEWAQGLIRSWNDAGWIDLPNRIASMIAPLIGAEPKCVTVADSTSINLFKVLAAAVTANPERKIILSEKRNFPTDLYIAEGLSKLVDKDHQIVLVETDDELVDAISDQCAVVMLTHVDFRTGRMLDMAALTRRAHDVGALVVWDLAHSAGALPVHLDSCNADFAVGCGYKYLNGGPGAPSFVYVNERHLGKVRQPLTGWFSHRAPFTFEHCYRPTHAISQFQCGTSPVLSMIALEEALSIWEDVDMTTVRAKSLALTDFFRECVFQFHLSDMFECITPDNHALRGSQISLVFDGDGYAVMQALISHNVIGDFREPDILRFGFAPLYNSFVDVYRAVEVLAAIIESGEWRQVNYSSRKAVT